MSIAACHRRLVLVAIATALWVTPASAQPRQLAAPGGIVMIPIAGDDKSTPRVEFGGKRTTVVRDDGRWLAIVGVPLATKPGEHAIRVTPPAGAAYRVSFEVSSRDYPEQRLTVKNPRHVNPDPDDLTRIRAERVRIGAALSRFRDEVEQPPFVFEWPVRGRQSSAFGLRRFFNGEPRNPHSGLDIAAPTGTPILAPAKGLVTETGNYFYNGNAVFVDHGQGLVTMYCHMSEITAQVGDQIEVGDELGKVGATGRVTGPHLHFSVALNDTMVDPLLLLVEAPPAP
jgi:murein DD-endopeptidase MepM/ murein hydrolase activator NlpD